MTRRGLLALLLLPAMLLSACGSGRQNADGTGTPSGEAKTRPVETITINNACYGEFTICEEDQPLFSPGAILLWMGKRICLD